MKLQNNESEVLSNAKSEKMEFTFSSNSQDIGLAIEIITNRSYKRKIVTPVQEYICNARDAHREIGQTRPIEICVPTVFSPQLTIRDFGPGITPEKMGDVFVKFFASTKRRDNKQTGGFGLGAKSAWAYSDAFSIVSITNGVKRSYTAYKTGQGLLQPEGEEQTSEPSGLEIIIPVKSGDVKEFEKAVRRCVSFWKESERPLVKGMTMTYPATPQIFGQFAFYSESEISSVMDYRYIDDLIILDGIPYELSHEDRQNLGIKFLTDWRRPVKQMCMIVSTGEVSVTPFRESLEFNDHTKQAIQKLIDNGIKAVQSAFKKDFENAKDSIKEKIEVLKKYSSVKSREKTKLSESLTYDSGHVYFSIPTKDVKGSFTLSSIHRHGDKMKNILNEENHIKMESPVIVFSMSSKAKVMEYDSAKEKLGENHLRRKLIQNKDQVQENYWLTFEKGSEQFRTLIEEVFEIIPLSSLPYQKPVVAPRGPVATTVTATDATTEMNFVFDKGTELLENTVYMLASEYNSDRYKLRELSKYLLKEKSIQVVVVTKAMEKFIVQRGCPTLETYLKTIEVSETEMLKLFLTFELPKIETRLVYLKKAFENKEVTAFIDLIEKANKIKNFDVYRFGHLEKIQMAVKNRPEYQELLTITARGNAILKEQFPLILCIDALSMENLTEELEIYIQAKESKKG